MFYYPISSSFCLSFFCFTSLPGKSGSAMFYHPISSTLCFTSFTRQKRRKRAKYLNAASLMQRNNASRPAHPRTSPSLDDSISSASSTLNLRHPVPSYGGAMTYYPPQAADQGDGSPSRTGGPMIPSRSYGNGFQTTSNQVRTSDIELAVCLQSCSAYLPMWSFLLFL